MVISANPEGPGNVESFIERNLKKELLRFTTAGSVDDGKSTLIGRLLHDTKTVYEDQLAAIRNSRINRSTGPLDFSLLTDGLRAEREQGITIDVAHRYFETPRRKFIIADTPGHEQYTRNMATGASTAQLAVILIDGTKGLLPQTRRHAFIASLLGIPNVVAAVNKLDLMNYSEDVFLRLQEDFRSLAAQLGVRQTTAIPISALEGDNVVTRSHRMPWYDGPTLLEHLETVPVQEDADTNLALGLRFPVQYVIRPDAGFRGFAGQLAGGVLRPGDPVVSLPAGRKTRVRSIVTYDGSLPEAFPPMSVTLALDDEIDLSRGDMLVSPGQMPHVSRQFGAMVVWFDAEPFGSGRNYLLKHTSRTGRIKASKIRHRVNVNTMAEEPASTLHMNEIAYVEFEMASPLFFDPYARNHITGSFILIDPISNATVAAGMIQEELGDAPDASLTPGRAGESLTSQERYTRQGHYPALILIEGRSGLAGRLERALFEDHFHVVRMDGEELPASLLASQFPLFRSLGLVVIYSAADVSAETKQTLRELAGDHFFDLSALPLPANEDETVEKVVVLVQPLRMPSDR